MLILSQIHLLHKRPQINFRSHISDRDKAQTYETQRICVQLAAAGDSTDTHSKGCQIKNSVVFVASN